MHEIKQKATWGVIWSAVGTWGNQFTSFVVFAVLTRLLVPEAFGLIAMATVFTNLVNVFAEQGFGQAIVQREQLEPEHLDTAFWTNVIIGSGLALLGIMLSGLIAQIYDEPQLQPVVAMLSITFIFTALSSTQQSLLERALNFRALSNRQLVAAVTGGIVGIGAALGGAGVYSLVAMTLTNRIVGTFMLWQVNEWRPRLRYSRKHFSELLKFGLSVMGVNLTNFLRAHIDDFVIGLFLGAEVLGFYVVAYRLGRLTLGMFTTVMSRVAITTFARLQNNSERVKDALYRFTGIASLVTFPIFTGFIVLTADLLVAVSGDQWLPSVPIMRILSIAGYSLSLQYFLSYLIISLGKPDRLLITNIISTIFTSMAFIYSVQYGVIAVAISYAVVNILFYAVYLLVANQVLSLNIKKYLIAGWRFFVPSVVMGIFTFALNQMMVDAMVNLYVRLFLSIGFGACIYAVIVFFLYRDIYRELRGILTSLMPASRASLNVEKGLPANDTDQ